MNEENFYKTVREKYGSRGIRQAEELLEVTRGIGPDAESQKAAKQALMTVFLKHKEENKKYAPKKYRK